MAKSRTYIRRLFLLSIPSPDPVESAIAELTPDELDRYPVGVITLDRQGLILRYNRAEALFARRSPHGVIGRSFFGDVAPCAAVREFSGRFEEFARHHDSGAEKFAFRFAFAWGSQDVAITLVRRAEYDEIHMIIGVRSMRRPQIISAQTAKPANALEAPGDAPLHVGHWTESSAGLAVWSDALAHIIGVERTAEPLALERYLDFVHHDDVRFVRAAILEARSVLQPARVDHRIINRRGETRSCALYVGVDGTTQRLHATIVDFTEQRRDANAWWKSAHFDELTGLPNRKLFMQRLDAAIARGDESLALIFIDLDRFKLVNDTAGHDVGDQVLRLTASRLMSCTRSGDTVARLNGDEFVALITGVDSHAAAGVVAEKIREAILLPFVIDEVEHYVMLSAGIALWPQDGAESDSLLQAADIAMYHAKQQGSNEFQYFDADIRDSIRSARVRENDLRRAIDARQFVLEYQPIFKHDGTLEAVEALVRWAHPTLGLLAPNEFIPLAEKSGSIVPLGAWILGEACRQMRAWQDLELGIERICVNISSSQFKGRRFAEDVAAALVAADLAPTALELELTESVIVDRFDETLAALAELKMLGVRLSIDDFGTGYSALSYLKFLPVDVLKLDRSFVAGMGSKSLDDAIAGTIVSLATLLKLDVVAEGVETREQLDALGTIGCTHVQGFYLGRPMSAENVSHGFADPLASKRPDRVR